MAESDKYKKYKENLEAWQLSEIKGTLIVCYQKYLENRASYIEATQVGNLEPRIAKSNMIATLDAYFQNCQAPFMPYVEKENEKIVKLMRIGGVIEEEVKDATDLIHKYQNLPIYGLKYTSELLFFMGNILNRWNTEKGYFRLLSKNPEFDTEEDVMDWVLANEEN